MSDANPSTNPSQPVSPSPGLSRAAIFLLCATYALAGAGAGLWLGRHGFNREPSRPTAPSSPSAAAALPEQDADAAKRNYDRVARQIQMLDKEKNLLDLELNEDVLKKLAEKELALGEGAGICSHWEGKQLQFQRLVDSQTRVQGEISGIQGRRDDLARRLEQRLALPQVEAQIQGNARYAEARRYSDEAARQLDELKSQSKPDGESVKAAERRNDAAAARLSVVHEELRSMMIDALKDQLEGEFNADTANLARLDKLVAQAGSELGELSQTMIDYRVLQEREKRLRGKLDSVQDRLSELRVFDLQGIPSANLMRTSLPAGAE